MTPKLIMAKFIVFEGIDGCGKSTQAKLFAEKLFDYSKSNHVLLTREPYESEEIRTRLREEEAYSNPELMAELFIQDRKSHLGDLIITILNKGIHVVSDRYKMSTIAYQATQGLDMGDLIKRHAGMLVPYITFLVDTPVDIAIERSGNIERKFEGNRPFQEKLRENYFIARKHLLSMGETVYVVDGTKSIDELSEDIWELFVYGKLTL